MVALLNLFGRSPFALLKSHMNLVADSVHMLTDLFDAMEKKDYPALEAISEQICEKEHAADEIKNNIREHLPKSLFLPMDRGHLLEILHLQDNIADAAEDIAVLVTLKALEVIDPLREDLKAFLKKNIEAFDGALDIINEMHDLLETSFGGIEAEKVRKMIENVAAKEHEIDLFQRKLLKGLFRCDDQMSYSTFYLWQKIFETIALISNDSEKLAYRVKMTLSIK